MLTIPFVLTIAAIIFALLALFSVPSRVSWTALGVLCLGVVILLAGSGVLR